MPEGSSAAGLECPSCRDAVARVVAATEALRSGDELYALGILDDLEDDLDATLSRMQEAA